MDDPVAMLIELLQGGALMGFGALLYSVIIPRFSGTGLAVALGVLFGVGAIAVMVDPVEVTPGVRVDARTCLVVVSALFGGPLSATITAVIIAIFREYLGGVGTLAGQLSVVAALVVGIAAHYLVARRGTPLRSSDIFLLACSAPLFSLPILSLGLDDGFRVLQNTFVPATIVRFSGILFLGLLILHERRRLDAEREVRRLAFHDELSGVANRRAFYLQLDHVWSQWVRYGEPFSVMILDIDRFKSINDRFGHPVGDEVIRALGTLLREDKRGADVAARIGGEEFAVLLPKTTAEEAAVAAERLRALVEATRVPALGGAGFTISVGISADSTDHMSAQDALSSADRALYEAKNRGRNQVAATPTTTVALPRPVRPRPVAAPARTLRFPLDAASGQR